MFLRQQEVGKVQQRVYTEKVKNWLLSVAIRYRYRGKLHRSSPLKAVDELGFPSMPMIVVSAGVPNENPVEDTTTERINPRSEPVLGYESPPRTPTPPA